MHKFVGKHTFLAVLLAITVLLSMPAIQTFAASRIAYGWTPWSCKDLSALGVPGGTMYSQGCAIWTDDSSFQWGSGAITSSSGVRAYAISTYATGYDRCYSTDPWTWRNSTNSTVYNANWAGAGEGVGYYADCGQNANHTYMVWSEHYWQQTSNSGLIEQAGNNYW